MKLYPMSWPEIVVILEAKHRTTQESNVSRNGQYKDVYTGRERLIRTRLIQSST